MTTLSLPMKRWVFAGLLTAFSGTLTARVTPDFYEGETNPDLPGPGQVLQYPLGDRAARHHEAVAYLQVLDSLSGRVRLMDIGQTLEGRPLLVCFVSSEENIQNLETIRRNMELLADPRKSPTGAELESLVAGTPVIAWMMYNVHGNELSGTDAALQLVYQLAAGKDERILEILRNVVVAVDPSQNPDGRERCLAQIQQWSGLLTVPDVQSIQHQGTWPSGRTNHYLFDMNRDWFVLSQPETRARVHELVRWNPQLVVDAHEMGSFSTYFFNPPRKPINPLVHSSIRNWWKAFSRDQAQSFDEYGWSYYTNEDFDDWYPGYGSSWPYFSGAISILYEQARTAGSRVRLPAGSLLTFREAVHRQFVSSLANLTTAAKNREALLRDFIQMRRDALNPPQGSIQAYYVLPDDNPSRVLHLMNLLAAQGVEVYRTTEPVTLKNLTGYRDRQPVTRELPRGCFVVPTAQPRRPLIETLMAFDLRLDNDFLKEERESLEKGEGTRMYEVAAWSLPLAYAVECYASRSRVPASLERVEDSKRQDDWTESEKTYGFLVDFQDDIGLHVLLALMETEYAVRVAEKAFSIGGRYYPPGTLLLRGHENPDNLASDLKTISRETGAFIRGVSTALCDSGPDLGSGHYRLLTRSRPALLTGPEISTSEFGAFWYLMDHELRYPHTILTVSGLGRADLRPYNVIILPSARGLDKQVLEKLKKWVENGGTLVAVGRSAALLAEKETGMSRVVLRSQVLNQLSEYQAALEQERAIGRFPIDSLAIWEGSGSVFKGVESAEEKKGPSAEEDRYNQRFMPRGSFVKAVVNREHWLTFGMPERLPVLAATSTVFLAKSPVEVPVRFAEAESLRLSGLLWPEARTRLALSAAVTRERLGQGQIILIANDPFFRASTRGTLRLLTNAVFLGPGLGARQPVGW